ncbi:MAG: hypothetical protein H7X77_01790, partial [Anaerolineae bacterium]|nr:hypothetical protein [Anaerolineae bacterium]
MGKDFDKDDFSWMRDPDDDNGEQSEDDFPELDWLTDDADKQPQAGDSPRSGVTGALPWMRDRDSAGEQASTGDDDASFDWMTDSDDQTAKPDSKRLGVTGELSWLGGNKDEAETTRPDSARTGVTGQLDWRNTSLEDQLAAAEKAAGVQRDLPPIIPADD